MIYSKLHVVYFIMLTAVGMAQSNLNDIHTLTEFINVSEQAPWKIAQSDKGISIQYRNLTLNDTLETRELLVRLTANTTLEKAKNYVTLPENIIQWNDAVKDIKYVKQNSSYWIAHTLYDIPFPLSKQDLVAKYWVEYDGNTIIIHVKSVPDAIPETKGYDRESYNLSQWRLIPKNNTITVEFAGITLSNSKIPRFIKDPIIQRKLLNSFIHLKTILETSDL